MSKPCPYCGKPGIRRLGLHLRYCDKAPLTEEAASAGESLETEEEEEEPIEVVVTSRRRRAKERTFMPMSARRGPLASAMKCWYLRKDGALGEDAFCATNAWSMEQREYSTDKGLIEITHPEPLVERDGNGRIRGRRVVLNMPSKARWAVVCRTLAGRRKSAIEDEMSRLEDEKILMGDARGTEERRSARHRMANCEARIRALQRSQDEELYQFFVDEVKASRAGLETRDEQIQRIIDDRLSVLLPEEDEDFEEEEEDEDVIE